MKTVELNKRNEVAWFDADDILHVTDEINKIVADRESLKFICHYEIFYERHKLDQLFDLAKKMNERDLTIYKEFATPPSDFGIILFGPTREAMDFQSDMIKRFNIKFYRTGYGPPDYIGFDCYENSFDFVMPVKEMIEDDFNRHEENYYLGYSLNLFSKNRSETICNELEIQGKKNGMEVILRIKKHSSSKHLIALYVSLESYIPEITAKYPQHIIETSKL